MKLENYELHLPSYSVGKEVYNQIGKICKPYGTKVLVIGGKKALSAAFDKISKNAADGGLDIDVYKRQPLHRASHAHFHLFRKPEAACHLRHLQSLTESAFPENDMDRSCWNSG